jgi:hypothetical protein
LKSTIVRAQEKQKDKQNLRTKRILRTYLEIGTTVFRKNDGIITKLEPRWIGPYKIFDHDDRGSYSLIDATGVGMQQKLPLEKLKVVDNSVMLNDLKEIKVIIDDKTIDNKLEYLCEWKDGSKSTWVKEADFQTIDIINDYWRNKVKPKNKRGRPKKNVIYVQRK